MITKKCGYRLISLFFIICLSVSSVWAQYDIVPMPQRIELQKGEPFTLWGDLVQIVAPENLNAEAAFLQTYLRDITGSTLPIASKRNKGMTYIELTLSPKVTEPEGYVMTINKKGVTIAGGSAAGIFYGIQTFRKAVVNARQTQHITELTNKPSASSATPPFTLLNPVVITDAPRFSWRGMHLDCSRHFFSVEFVKKFIDLLALHNMNVFHWHLTDDQGWRIEIKKWPRLTTVGSQRSGTIIGTNSDIDDGIPYGGYYTQAELHEIVAYAAARHITIVPEIDMPGHMLAALAAYPELGCTGGPYQVGHYWGVYKDVLCVGNPRVYEFVQDVLTEVMDIFPSEVIHIGGDETPSEKWQHCKKCNEIYIKKALEGRIGAQPEEGPDGPRKMPEYSNEEIFQAPMQSYFTNKVFNILASKGRRALGWDEILEGSPAETMIMSWRGSAPGAKAAEAGHDVVMAPTTHCYFDYQQVEDTQFEPSRCGGFIPIEKVYSLDPAPDTLSVEARSHILGTQANLWTEYMVNGQMVEYQALPRMSALAEVQWTQPERKNYKAFLQRLTRFTSLFEQYHYTYAKHLWPDRQIPNRWQF
ncbi:MAG: beta-N-acetylhexosaminidase [Prevotella sp.]|nr:beta-N-acetylhexosaminidase [Prevotella sp.]